MGSNSFPPRFFDVEDAEGRTFPVIGNCSANDCTEALERGYVVRLLIGEGERAFVADHVILNDGRIAMTTSKWDTRKLYEATKVELGYGVARSHSFAVLEPERSLFATDLFEPVTESAIDPSAVWSIVEESA